MSEDYKDLMEDIAARTGALAIGLTLVLPNEEVRCLSIVTRAPDDEPLQALLFRLSSALILAARRVFDKASAFGDETVS